MRQTSDIETDVAGREAKRLRAGVLQSLQPGAANHVAPKACKWTGFANR